MAHDEHELVWKERRDFVWGEVKHRYKICWMI